MNCQKLKLDCRRQYTPFMYERIGFQHFYLIYGIINTMHKNFYASGFLYHLPSKQILLQQNNSISSMPPSWLLFGGLYSKNEDPESFFKDVIFKELSIRVKDVHSIYSYVVEDIHQYHSIVYSNLGRLQKFSPKNNLTFAWFSFKDIPKLKIAEQTKHDIIVGQRVIEAARRKSQGEHTLE